jgi:hypothetical protein
MANRLVCPECHASLKPARPVPDGVRVKCPKCTAAFTAPGLVDAADAETIQPAPVAKAKAKPAKEAVIPAAAKQATTKPSPAPATAGISDDEEGGGTYDLLDKPGAEEKKPEISYAPDTSIKDLRGPAVTAVVPPSNHMIRFHAIGALLALAWVLIEVWPFIFSEHLIDHRYFFEEWYKTPHEGVDMQKARQRIKALPEERKDLNDYEKGVLEDAESFFATLSIVMAIVFFVVMIYDGIVVVAATKMQNLESRGWGIAGAIMTLALVGAAPHLYWDLQLSWLFLAFLDVTVQGIFSYGMFMLVLLLGAGAAYPIIIGVWSLRVLLSPEVIAGYEYVPEDG